MITVDVIAYARVSTEEQAREGISLEAQKSRITAWAHAMDYRVIAQEEDAGVSGKNIKAREGLIRALKIACEEKAALVVYSLSRLSRSTRDTLMIAEMLDKAGADLVSLSERIDTSSASGKMIFRLMAVLSEFERDMISERTAAVLQHKKSRLEAYSPTPYGYTRKGNTLAPDPEEQRIISKIRRMRRRGKSLRGIAKHLNERGIPSKRDARWHHSTINYILSNALHEQ